MLILIALYTILGFLYAWTVGIVAREEIYVRSGVLIVVIPLLVRIALSVAQIQLGLIGLGLDFALLLVGSKLIARLDWKPALIVSAIYTAILLVVYVLLTIAFS